MDEQLLTIRRIGDEDVDMNYRVQGHRDRRAIAKGYLILLRHDKFLAKVFKEMLEVMLMHPEMLEKDAGVVIGKVPWDNNHNQQ